MKPWAECYEQDALMDETTGERDFQNSLGEGMIIFILHAKTLAKTVWKYVVI